MSTEFIVGTVITVALALLGGTAGLIKLMIVSRLDELQERLEEMVDRVQDMEVRFAVLEDQHKQRMCVRREIMN